MIKNNGKEPKIDYLFYGTGKMDPEQICKDQVGIDIHYANAGTYGKALYFTQNAEHKDKSKAFKKYDGTKQLLLVKVIVGECKTLYS